MNNKGFTLIELIAVMIILSVVATFGIRKYMQFDANAGHQIEELQNTAQDRKDGLYQYAGIEERTEEDAVNDAKKEEENNSQ
jgi:prepilin-type N-terminal cleavage/methylation domain-containing protein